MLKTNISEKKEKITFNQDLKKIFPNFTQALMNKSKKDEKFHFNLFIQTDIIQKTQYNIKNICKRIDILSKHYQKKFQETGEQEYNIKTFDLAESNDDNFIKFITDNTPKKGKPPISFVFTDYFHATPAVITDDNKIYIINLSQYDNYNKQGIQEKLEDISVNLNKKIISCENYNMDRKDTPQKSNHGCVVFAFKYLKMLGANNHELFKALKPSPTKQDTCILPPDLLKYAQSETVVTKALNNYKSEFGLSDEKRKEITDYRKNKNGKFRIVYHQIKHYTKDNKEEIITSLDNITNKIRLENMDISKG